MEEANKILDILREMPSWADVSHPDKDLKPEIMADMRRIATHSIEAIKAAIQAYVDQSYAAAEGYTTMDMGKLFVLNRFLFNVPLYVSPDRPGFGGFLGVPVEEGRVNKLWPLAQENDELTLKDDYKGYAGESYPALKEFEFFYAQYGIRTSGQAALPTPEANDTYRS